MVLFEVFLKNFRKIINHKRVQYILQIIVHKTPAPKFVIFRVRPINRFVKITYF